MRISDLEPDREPESDALPLWDPARFEGVEREAEWDFELYRRFLAQVEAATKRAAEVHPMACRRGCFHCCRRIPSLLPVEWAYSQAASMRNSASGADAGNARPAAASDSVSTSSTREGRSGESGSSALESQLHPGEALCSFLDAQGECTIYERRPFICRTHGHALVWRDEETGDEGIDACPWNLEGVTEIDADAVLDPAQLHETLIAVNLRFLAAAYPSRFRDLARVRVRFQG